MKKIFFVVFSLIMMCSVSFAYEVISNVNYEITGTNNSSSASSYLGTSYTTTQVKNILKLLYSDRNNETYLSNFNDLTSEMNSLGYKWVVIENGEEFILLSSYNYDVEFAIKNYVTDSRCWYYVGVLFSRTSSKNELFYKISNSLSYNSVVYYVSSGSNVFNSFNMYSVEPIIYSSNCDIYLGVIDSSSSSFVWDGESYFYQNGSSGDDSENGEITPGEVPELTDDELAELVTRFTNSDALINNHAIGHDDYFITYDTLMGYYRAYTYNSNIDLAISYGDYDEEGNFVTSGTEEGEAWQIRPYVFSGNVFNKLSDWLASKFNSYSFKYFSISPDSTISPRYVGMLQHSYCSNYKDYEVVVYTTKQIRFLGEKTTEEGETEVVVTDDYIPKTTLTNSETGEEYIFEIPEQNIGDTLYSQFVSLFQNLGDRIASIFEPDVTSVSYLKSTIESKLPVIGELKTIIDNLLAIFSNENPEPPTITIPLSQAESSIDYGADCIALDLSWYERYKDTVDLVIIGFAYAFFAWRLYHRIPGIISGSDGINWSVLSGEKTEYSGSGKFGFKPGGGNK